jgi:thiol:disulfide interchange protein DsbD
LDYLAAFFGGVLISFTPCVYPLLPVTIGYIGANSAGSKSKGLLLSFLYVSGIAFTYSALGLFAALSGTLFGRMAFGPYGYFLAAAAVFFFGLSMLDLFQLRLFPGIKLPALKRGSCLSTFFLGLVSGLVASPCLTPVLGSILAYIAGRQNVFYGAALLLVFAYGMGAVLMLAGAFSGVLANLPKLGRVTHYIKRFCALLLFLAAAYFVWEGIRRL